MPEVLVIGGGLIGAAAARHLAVAGASVVVAGPPEPERWASHEGVFASHYDEGRITRKLDADPVWAELARISVERYAVLEESSGVRFFQPGRCLQLLPEGPGHDASREALKQRARDLDLNIEELSGNALSSRFPALQTAGHSGHLESGTAGWINPRALVRAQRRLAERSGVRWVPQPVTALEQNSGRWQAHCANGEILEADAVLLSGGAFVNELLDAPLPLQLRTRIVVFAELDAERLERLSDLPCLLVTLEQHPRLEDVYLLPPIRYPDGKTYVKIGGSNLPLRTAASVDDLKRWFRQGGDRDDFEPLREVLTELIPDLKAAPLHHQPCVTTYTASDRPLILPLDTGLFAATGGCGRAAKSSEALGDLAARMVLGQAWPQSFITPNLFTLEAQQQRAA